MSSPEPLEPILVLEDVRAGYGGGAVLRGVSLAVRPGEIERVGEDDRRARRLTSAATVGGERSRPR
jgi:ABC-type histidine transport system ATPase subunit